MHQRIRYDIRAVRHELYTEKLAVVPGTAFGDCGEGFIRISYAYSLENLKEAMNRMEAFIRAEKQGEKQA